METLIISKLKELKIVLAGFALCLMLLIIRLKATQSFFLLFLGWNIILAMIPYALSFALLAHKKWRQTWWIWIPVSVAWLLFLPNAPYLITDLQHLRKTSDETLWYDIILFATFIWYALTMMVLSVRHMDSMLPKKLTTTKRIISLIVLFGLCGFGIYLGRYLRWNSWDIVQNPFKLLSEVWFQIRHPKQNIQTWFITFGYGVLLSLIYFGANQIQLHSSQDKIDS